jgi:hypothetical protein
MIQDDPPTKLTSNGAEKPHSPFNHSKYGLIPVGQCKSVMESCMEEETTHLLLTFIYTGALQEGPPSQE